VFARPEGELYHAVVDRCYKHPLPGPTGCVLPGWRISVLSLWRPPFQTQLSSLPLPL
jgi:hypothetical protein